MKVKYIEEVYPTLSDVWLCDKGCSFSNGEQTWLIENKDDAKNLIKLWNNMQRKLVKTAIDFSLAEERLFSESWYNEKEKLYRREAVNKFAKVMLKKLSQNKHKGPWSDVSTEHLMRLMEDEIEELKNAIQVNQSKDEVVREAADVANFAMMIADNYKQC